MAYSSSDEEAALLFLTLLEEQNSRKRKWVHDINMERPKSGEYHALMPQLKRDPVRFHKYFRMTKECFGEIAIMIQSDIEKLDTNYREAISVEERLAITLRFLATGDSYSTIGHSYRVGFSTVGGIVKDVCLAICNRLQPIYMPPPTQETWERSEKGFRETWNFPNCIGSIDGKHVTIKCPAKSGSKYFCYLHKFSMVLMAIVGPDYAFLCVDVGGYGKNSDGGLFEASNMGQKFEAGEMKVPSPKALNGQNEPCPYVLVGDEAFGLKPYLMRPFPYRQAKTDTQKELFNNHLCRARRVVENAFGILAQRWRFLFRPLATDVETSKTIVLAACILHNFLITKKSSPEGFQEGLNGEDQPSALRNIKTESRRATDIAFNTREKFVEYFNAL